MVVDIGRNHIVNPHKLVSELWVEKKIRLRDSRYRFSRRKIQRLLDPKSTSRNSTEMVTSLCGSTGCTLTLAYLDLKIYS